MAKVTFRRIGYLVLVLTIGFAAAFVSGCRDNNQGGNGTPPPPPPPARISLDIRGSDTMVNLGAAWAETYMDLHSNFSIAVQGGGSGTGIAQLLNKNCDIAQASRGIKGSEIDAGKAAGLDVYEVIAAYDGVAMVVHPANPVEELTIEQLGEILRGEITNWSAVGGSNTPIVVASRDTASGTHVFIKELLVQRDGALKDAEYGPQVQFLPSTSAIVTEVSQNVNAFGYVGLGYMVPEIKAIKVKADADSPGVAPSVAAVQAGTYGVARPLFLYLPGEPEGAVKDYIDWILSAAGQEIVAKLGFVPTSE